MPYLLMKEQKSLWDSWLLGGVHAGTTVSPLLLEAGATVSKLGFHSLRAVDVHSEIALRS